jgi:tetratricopeptide (TPR) repeat protein
MKRWIWPALAIVVLIVAGVTLVALPSTPEWTTSSADALAEFEAGEAALNKFYMTEALRHFERATEIDPGFLFAKWRVTRLRSMEGADQPSQFVDELMKADLSRLTPRERFFIEYWRAVENKQPEEAARLLDECVKASPNDTYILDRKARVAWLERDFDVADRVFQEVLERDLNWVTAYNMLGYIKMEQGRFKEAEEHFKSYRFIAPDQANPHDSLGELYITVGRYDEAEISLNRAIEIKKDFWASYLHLAIMFAYIGDFDAVERVIDRGRGAGMPDDARFGMECRARFAELANRDAWRRVFDERDSECVSGFENGFAAIVTHRAACHLGEWETAMAFEEEAARILADAEKSGNDELTLAFRPVIPHLEGVRHAIDGKLGAAEEQFRVSDDLLTFMGADVAMYKLYNRLLLVEALLASRKDAEAHQLLTAVRRINPPMVQEFEASGFRFLGLGRGEHGVDSAVVATSPPDGSRNAM